MRIHKISELPSALQAEIAELGETRSGLLCPTCEGGRSKEQSLSIWRDAPFVIAKCWRDGCGYLARVPVDDGWEDADLRRPSFKPRVYKGDLMPLGSAGKWFETTYTIKPCTLLEFGVKKAMHKRAFYFPVLGPNLEERGGVLRYFDGTEPKAISYKHSDQPWQAWFRPYVTAGNTVVVEDILSAMRVYQLGRVAVALLGTNLSLAKERELFAERYGPILLALDKDAFPRAIKYARRNPRFVPILLDRDIKDEDDETIRQILSG